MLHRDLAARNVLVHRLDPVHVKVCDFGHARPGTRWDALSQLGNASDSILQFPIRWMAPEGLVEGNPVWTEKSDVWSFGVTIWEILSNAREPFEELSDTEVLLAVRRGVRLPLPADICEDLVMVGASAAYSDIKNGLINVRNHH